MESQASNDKPNSAVPSPQPPPLTPPLTPPPAQPAQPAQPAKSPLSAPSLPTVPGASTPSPLALPHSEKPASEWVQEGEFSETWDDEPVLGRSLASLLEGQTIVGKPSHLSKSSENATGSAPPSSTQNPFAKPSTPQRKGVDLLLQGSSAVRTPASPDPTPQARPNAAQSTPTLSSQNSSSQWEDYYFYALDVLLIALALIILFTSPLPLTHGKLWFCSLAVLLAACSGLYPIWRKANLEAIERETTQPKTPEWIHLRLNRPASTEMVVHLWWPFFLGEVRLNPSGDLEFIPIPLKDLPKLPTHTLERLKREGLDFYRIESEKSRRTH